MQNRKTSFVLLAFAPVILTACGGGGGGDTVGQVNSTAVTPGHYAGTYDCAATSGSDGTFVAILPTDTGAFSSCSGSVDGGSVAFTCTGSISSAGAFSVSTVDTHGVTGTETAIASGAVFSGTSMASNGVAGGFSCTHY